MAVTFRRGVLLLSLVCVFESQLSEGYNIDVENARLFRGPNGSFFGFTTSFLQTDKGYELLVGSPKDNTQHGNETGSVYFCDVNDPSTCQQFYDKGDKSRQGIWKTYSEDGEMYGSFVAQTSNASFVTCANRWKDTKYEYMNYIFLLGRCQIISRTSDPVERNSYPFYDNRGNNYLRPINQISVYWYGVGEAGFAGDTLQNGSFIVGAPGMKEWRGSVLVIDGKNNYEIFDTPAHYSEYGYLGYSIAQGNLCGPGRICFAAGAPRLDSRGLVFVFEYNEHGRIIPLHTLDGSQDGAFFGASLCAVDINGDGWDDLLVGAPFYTDIKPQQTGEKKIYVDEGRVFIYMNQRKYKDQDNFLESSVVLTGSNVNNARFGTTVARIGDINDDGYQDVAVGAPHEDDGMGAVYIYNGGRNGLKDKFTQKILGKTVSDDMISFGWQISKPADVDNNKYPDIAVGNFMSDTSVILRTRPIIDLQSNLTTSPSQIILNGSFCPPSIKDEGCFTLQICFTYTGKSLPSTLDVQCSIEVDTFKSTELKRVMMNTTQGDLDHVTTNMTVQAVTGSCHEYMVFSRRTQRHDDPFTVVHIKADFSVVQPADPGSDIQPVTNASRPSSIEHDIAFQLQCGDDNQCDADLVLGAAIRLPQDEDYIIVNKTKKLFLDFHLKNNGEDAFAAVVHISGIKGLHYRLTESTPEYPVFCEKITAESDDTHDMKCQIARPVRQNGQLAFFTVFDASDIATDEQLISIQALAQTSSNETNPEDDVANTTTRVYIVADVEIEGKSEPEEITLQMDGKKDKSVNFLHKYVIKNNGPSFLPSTNVTIDVPYYFKDGKGMVAKSSAKMIYEDGSETFCESASFEGNVGLPNASTTSVAQSTTVSTKTTNGKDDGDGGFTFLPPPDQRRKRSILYPRPEKIDKSRLVAHDIKCDNYACVRFHCRLREINPGDNVVVNISLEIPADRLEFSKDVNVLRYQTPSVVAQPNHPLFFPWKNAVEATIVTPIYKGSTSGSVNIWIIIGSVLGGLILLTIVFLVLWKLGFFRRQKKAKLQKWKRESGYYKSRKNPSDKPSTTGEEQNCE